MSAHIFSRRVLRPVLVTDIRAVLQGCMVCDNLAPLENRKTAPLAKQGKNAPKIQKILVLEYF